MDKQIDILDEIKLIILQQVSDATIYLFGSRATGKVHEESDWDILILTKTKYPKVMQWKIQDALFPLSVKLYSFINIIMTSEDEWSHNPSYYSLKLNLSTYKILAL